MFGKGKIWFDGKLVNWKKANIHILSHAVHYGSSVFEGIRCYNVKETPCVFRLESHIGRMYDSAKIYRMDIPYTKAQFINAVLKVVKVNKLKS